MENQIQSQSDEFTYDNSGSAQQFQGPVIIQNQIIDDDNGWNSQIEADARHIGEKSGGLRWMHNSASGVFLKRYWIMTAVNIVLAAIIIAFNSITGANCNPNTTDPYKIVSIVGGAILGISTTYSSVKNYGGRVTAHQVSEGNFLALFYTIKNQLHLNRRDRQFGKDFIEWVQKEYIDLSSNPDGPNIPGFIFEQYTTKIEGTDMAMYNDIESIEIKKDSPPRREQSIPINLMNNHFRGRRKPSRARTHGGRDQARQQRPTQSARNDNNRQNDDNFTVTIPNNRHELTPKEKWQLSRFYDNQK